MTSNLRRTRALFNGTLPVDVESEGTARAHVRVIWSDMHLCPLWFADPEATGRGARSSTNASHAWFCIDALDAMRRVLELPIDPAHPEIDFEHRGPHQLAGQIIVTR